MAIKLKGDVAVCERKPGCSYKTRRKYGASDLQLEMEYDDV